MFRNAKRFTAILLVLILAASTFAFANANTVTPTNVGSGTTAVSGYTIANIVYDLTTGNPTLITTINFNVNPTAGAVAATYVAINTKAAGSEDWAEWGCLVGTPPAWICTPVGATTVASIMQLQVIASSSLNP